MGRKKESGTTKFSGSRSQILPPSSARSESLAGGQLRESRQDDVSNVVNELAEDVQDVLIERGTQFASFLQRYVDCELPLHLHFVVALGGKAGQHCAIVKHVGKSHDVGVSTAAISQVDVSKVGDASSDGKPTVFVDVFECIQDVQRMEFVVKALLPSVVRLQRIDECRHLIGESGESLQLVHLMPVPLQSVADGEHSSDVRGVRRFLGVSANERIDNMVEGSTKVVDAVPDQQSDNWWRLGQSDDDVDFVRVRIELFPNAARAMSVPPNHAVQNLEVFMCAENLLPSYRKLRVTDALYGA